MKRRRLKKYISRVLKLYLFYILVSAILLFAIQKPSSGGLSADDYLMAEKLHDRVALIETGEEGARVRLDLAEAAQTSIDISYYTVTNGKFTEAFLSCLLGAADRGVRVRILFDGLTRIAYERKDLRDAVRGFETHPNIEVRYYEKFNSLTPWAWHTRLHEKTIIVDGKLALIGGRNIGDKYFIKDEYQSRFVNDRDALIYHEGPEASVIGDMQRYFDLLWEYKRTKPHRKKITSRQIERAKFTNSAIRNHYKMLKSKHPELFQKTDWNAKTYPAEAVQFVHNPLGRLNNEPWSLRKLLSLTSQARSSVFLQSPYIIPSRRMRNEIKGYGIQWEKLTILTNSKQSSPNVLAMAAYLNHRKGIVDRVAALHEYQGPDSIHGKSYIFDDSISVIGTVNLDARSSYIDTESIIIITSKEFASDLRDKIQIPLDNSVVVQDDNTYGGAAKEMKTPRLFSKIVGLFDFLL